jgi:phosphomethylpyrimidine synthase
MDMVTTHELRIQKELIERARSFGAKVVLEGPGHLLLSQVDEYVAQTDQLGVPRMPLGPIVTDAFPGLDHITSAVGASYMMSRSKGGIINSVTRVEHQGGIPNVGALIEALDAAQVAAHAATISYHQGSRQLDRRFSDSRSLIESCVLPRDGSAVLTRSKELAGCTRCGHLCPLTSDVYRA